MILNIINTVVIGMLFGIWTKDGINFYIKLCILVLFLADVMRMAGKI